MLILEMRRHFIEWIWVFKLSWAKLSIKHMEKPGSTFESQTFPGCYYEVVRELGRGGMGIVYLVLLRETATNRPVRPYAAKVIYEQYLQEKNSQ